MAEPQKMNLNFGDTIGRRIGKFDWVGTFIGLHTIGGNFVPILIKGRMIGKRFIPKHESPTIQPIYVRPANLNRYDHNSLEAQRYHQSCARSCGMELVL